MLVAGDVPGHRQGTAQVPLRKAPEPQMPSYDELVAHSGVYPVFACMQLGQTPAPHRGPPHKANNSQDYDYFGFRRPEIPKTTVKHETSQSSELR